MADEDKTTTVLKIGPDQDAIIDAVLALLGFVHISEQREGKIAEKTKLELVVRNETDGTIETWRITIERASVEH